MQRSVLKGGLDLVLLANLEKEPMHGYRAIVTIRKMFGIYFGPSTIYPELGKLEKEGFIVSKWETTYELPRKVYELTGSGRALLQAVRSSPGPLKAFI